MSEKIEYYLRSPYSNNMDKNMNSTYIHGTVSDMLNVLPYTNFEFLEPIAMIEKYNVAPLSGEITGGGFSNVWHRVQPCFGVMTKNSNDYNTYDLAKIIPYTSKISKDPLTLLQSEVDLSRRCAFSNINCILIYMVRCQELGHNIDSLITPELIREMWITRNAFAILLFIHTYFVPVPNLDDDMCNCIFTYFTLKYFKEQMATLPDLYTIYQTGELPDALRIQMEAMFTLPSQLSAMGFSSYYDVTVSVRKPFVCTKSTHTPITSNNETSYLLGRLTQDCSGYKINDVLEKYAQGRESHYGISWDDFHGNLIYFLDQFKHRISLLENLKSNSTIPRIPLCTERYPLIIMYEGELESFRNEWRATKPLQFGMILRLWLRILWYIKIY